MIRQVTGNMLYLHVMDARISQNPFCCHSTGHSRHAAYPLITVKGTVHSCRCDQTDNCSDNYKNISIVHPVKSIISIRHSSHFFLLNFQFPVSFRRSRHFHAKMHLRSFVFYPLTVLLPASGYRLRSAHRLRVLSQLPVLPVHVPKFRLLQMLPRFSKSFHGDKYMHSATDLNLGSDIQSLLPVLSSQ